VIGNEGYEAHILAGVRPIRSAAGAQFMKDNVAGMDVPDEIVARMKGFDKEQAAAEGVEICLEVAEEVRAIEGVRGLHMMTVSWSSILPELVNRLGLYRRPDVTEEDPVVA